MKVNKLGNELTSLSNHRLKNNSNFLRLSEDIISDMGDAAYRHNTIALRSNSIARILYYTDLYKYILDVPGVICEFGVQWGATLNLLVNLRTIFEPYNRSRLIFGFDTFEGFLNTHELDGAHCKDGDYRVTKRHIDRINELLQLQEEFAPMNEVKKFSLIEGDATKTIDNWLVDNPHAIISLAIFDMDIYKPTKDVLEKIIPRLIKGSVLVFDELNCDVFPGETLAVQEVLGLNNIRLKKSQFQPYGAWVVWEG